MEAARASTAARVSALIGSAHFGPTVVVTAVTLGFGVAVGASVGAVALLTAGMFTGQLSVGWSNDWLDAARDRLAGRRDKPVADGRVPPALVRTAALVALVPGLLLPFVAGEACGWLHLLFVASAWTYNLGLKATPASPLPYIVSFGSLPSLATLLLHPPSFAPWWATVAAAAFGVAAHFANVVPDIEADLAAGVRGLPQLLGARVAGIAAPVVLVIGIVVVALALAHPAPAALVALALGLVVAIGGLVAALRPHPGRVPFQAVMAAALLLVVALIASGGSLHR